MMNVQSGCPDEEVLQAFLDSKLSGERQSGLQQHVESCEDCQRTLERLEAQDTSLSTLASHLRAPRALVRPRFPSPGAESARRA